VSTTPAYIGDFQPASQTLPVLERQVDTKGTEVDMLNIHDRMASDNGGGSGGNGCEGAILVRPVVLEGE